jgi:RNA polymerase sigma-70 factor (ECF subfamily)
MAEIRRMVQKTANQQNTDHQEAAWIAQAKLDPTAFKPLYEKYFKKIYLFILRRVGDNELAGDLAQQVFLKALSNIGTYEDRGFPLSVWLFRIAINQCNEFFRKSKATRLVVLTDESVEKVYEEVTNDQTLQDWGERLPAILEELNADDLYIIELRFFEVMAFKEIGAMLGISETYAKVRTYRILEKMKKLFLEKK